MTGKGLMQGPKTDAMRTVERLLETREWLDRSVDDLIGGELVGKWIGVQGDRVVATGESAAKVREALGGQVGDALVVFVPSDLPTPI